MKILTAAAIFLGGVGFLTDDAIAFKADCHAVTSGIPFITRDGIPGEAQAGLWSRGSLTCNTKRGSDLNGHFTLVGPGAFISVPIQHYNFSIYCPFIGEGRLQTRISDKKKNVGFSGPYASAGLLVTGGAGMGMNARGGVCFILEAGAGVGARGGVMTVNFDSFVSRETIDARNKADEEELQASLLREQFIYPSDSETIKVFKIASYRNCRIHAYEEDGESFNVLYVNGKLKRYYLADNQVLGDDYPANQQLDQALQELLSTGVCLR